MKTSDFDYHLPPDLIAHEPVRPRDHSRLLILDRHTGSIQHQKFFEIGDFLHPGDLLVINESKVFKARLHGRCGGAQVEIFLLRPEGEHWIALAKPGKRLDVDSVVRFGDGTTCRVLEKHSDGTVTITFNLSTEEVFAFADHMGEVPLPPYINHTPTDENEYQTVYAGTPGSVAAPTAGLHFTPELMENLEQRCIRFAKLTLHVGLGTFRPMKSETIEEHVMHEEWIDIPNETLKAIEETKRSGKRVIAVGTTSVRALESGVRHGYTNIFITPGYQFKVIDGLITNFHLPKSTLLVLVSAFAGRELIAKIYQEAIEQKYRFYSFGDAMLIV